MSARTVRVSVGFPFFNCRSTLPDAIRSVFAQTYSDWELILLDDGSSDGSLELARAVDDPRVRVLSDGANRGLAYRLNESVRVARGEYIARMDADDLMHPERLAKQVEYLDAHPLVHLVDSAVYSIDAFNQPVGCRGGEPLLVSLGAAVRQGLLIHPAVTGRAEWFRHNPYDTSIGRAEDQELWCRSYHSTNFGRVQEPLLFYRDGLPGSEAQYLRRYLDSCQAVRRVTRKYGPSAVGWYKTALLIVQSFAKGELYRFCTALGLQSVLIKRRSSRLTDDERATASETINRVLGTRVPGLPDWQHGIVCST